MAADLSFRLAQDAGDFVRFDPYCAKTTVGVQADPHEQLESAVRKQAESLRDLPSGGEPTGWLFEP
jgi:hypothetical protein